MEKFWKIFSVVFIALFLLTGWMLFDDGKIGSSTANQSGDSPVFVGVILFMFGFLGVAFCILFARISKKHEEKWKKPSFGDPFIVNFLTQPIQNFWIAGCSFLAASISCVVKDAIYHDYSSAFAFPLIVGVGVMTCVYAYVIVFMRQN